MYVGIALSSFVLCFLMSWLVSANPARIGCGIPIAVMVVTVLAIVVTRPDSSTAAVAIPFYGLVSLCGSVRGTALGSILRRRRRS